MHERDGVGSMDHHALFPRYVTTGSNRGDRSLSAPGWFMGSQKTVLDARSEFRTRAMFSLDELTIHGRGLPELLQTGETNRGLHLHDHQHPQNVVGEISVGYDRLVGRNETFSLSVADPGEPALGPPAFMHRRIGWDVPDKQYPTENAYLLEAWRRVGSETFYARADRVQKDEDDLGLGGALTIVPGTGFDDRPVLHLQPRFARADVVVDLVGAHTLGFVHDLHRSRRSMQTGIGVRLTLDAIPPRLRGVYGESVRSVVTSHSTRFLGAMQRIAASRCYGKQ